MKPTSQLSPLERQERANDARHLLNHPLLLEAFDALQKRSIEELLAARLGDLTAQEAHARMKALDEIRGYLNSIVNDEKVAVSRESSRHPITR